MSEQETQKTIINGLSYLILNHLNRAALEQYHPCGDADTMDHRIADGKARAEKLRAIRQDFEDVITGVLY